MIREEISLSLPEFVGKIPIREEITVLPADEPNEHRTIGWTFLEVIGVAVVDEWVFMPWYKKLSQGRFWKELFEKLSPKR